MVRRLVLTLGFLCALPGPALAQAAPPAPVTTAPPAAMVATLTGSVKTASGVAVSGARVSASGPSNATTYSDASGDFTLTLPPGIYRIEVSKGGFVPAVTSDVAVTSGTSVPLTVALTQADLSSLRTIGTVTVGRSSAINTGAAAQTYVSSEAVANLANPQINDVLQRVPDLNIQRMGSQADTSIVLAGSQPYETQVLIDGHPVAFGQYGVWLSEYYSSFLIGGAEVQSGPGNTTPFANTAVGGTVNLLTPSFTRKSTAEVTVGSDSYFSQYSNALARGSLGKLSYVLGAGYGSQNGPYHQTNRCVVSPANPQNDNTPQSTGIIQFCGDASGSLFTKGEVFKARYDFSPATSFEAGFTGAQGGFLPQGTAWGVSLGPTKIVDCLPGFPVAGGTPHNCTNPQYAGNIGRTIDGVFWYPGGDVYSNQPIFTGQLRTSLGDTTLLVRPYAGSIVSIIDGGYEDHYPSSFSPPGVIPSCPPGVPLSSPACANAKQNVFETGCNNSGGFSTTASPQNTITVVNGQEECYQTAFSTYERDRLYGTTVSLLRPFGQNLLEFTYDYHGTQTFAYYNVPTNVAVPDTTERYSTFSLTGDLRLVRNLALKTGLYDTLWKLDGSQAIGPASSPTLGPLSRTLSHFDPHLALVFTPHTGLAYRFAFGTSETYPFAGQVSGVPFYIPPAGTASSFGILTKKNANLNPESSAEFGAGVDKRLGGGVLSFDLQTTTIHNVFESLTFPATVIGQTTIVQPVNVARLRADLATLKYVYAPFTGLGYNVALTADRSVLDGLPLNFYTSAPALPANGVQICGNGQQTPGIPVCIPYLKGYGQVNYRWRDGTYAGLGLDYEGKNNSYYQPPFAQLDFTGRKPVAQNLEFQFSVQNLLNTNNFSNLPAPNLGVPTVANVQSADGKSIQQTTTTTSLLPTLPRTVRVQFKLHTF